MNGTAAERIEAHQAQGRFIEVRGQRIFVIEKGEGVPVLLLHGVPASSYLYRKMLPLLAERGWRAISFDFPGLGLSDKPPGRPYDWHALAGWVGAVVDALGLEAVHLVVHDIAGPIGVEWAIGAQDRVRSLTILNTLLDVASFSPPFPMSMFRVPGLRHLAVRLQPVPLFHAMMKRKGIKHADRFDREDTAAYLELLRRGGGRKTFLAIMAGFVLTEAHRDYLRAGLEQAAFPRQIVWGEHEVAIPRAQLDYAVERFEPRHVHLVDGRHFIQEDQPEAVSAHIDSFCRT